jgi:hypothetical protein
VLDVADLRALLGLQQGGRQALLAAAVLSGGDYNADGAQRVGVLSALRVVAHLLQGEQVGRGGEGCATPLQARHSAAASQPQPPPRSPSQPQPSPLSRPQDDSQVLLRLALALRQGPDPELERLTKCTGCRACKHDSGRSSGSCKEHPKTKGCAACGTGSGCVPRPDARWAGPPPPVQLRCRSSMAAGSCRGLPGWPLAPPPHTQQGPP